MRTEEELGVSKSERYLVCLFLFRRIFVSWCVDIKSSRNKDKSKKEIIKEGADLGTD